MTITNNKAQIIDSAGHHAQHHKDLADAVNGLLAGTGSNVVISTTDPALASPYVWVQVDGSGNLVSVWLGP